MVARLPAALVFVAALANCERTPTSTTAPSASMAAPLPVETTAPVVSAAPVTTADAGGALEPAPAHGFLWRDADGTCQWNYSEYCCPPRALCKPMPPLKNVVCPPLGKIASEQPKDGDFAWREQRADGKCYAGADRQSVQRTLCCKERYADKR